MLAISSLLTTSLSWEIRARVVASDPIDVSRVTFVEDLTQIDALEPGALVALARATVEDAGGYRFDVFLRHAVRRGVAAVVVRRSTARSLTAEALATQGRISLLEVDDEVDPAAVVDELTTLVAGDARAALRRLAAASSLDVLDEDEGPDEAVGRVGSACGVVLEYERGYSADGASVVLGGRPVGVVRARERGDLAAVAARLGAEAAAQVLARREHLVVTPFRTTSAALNQLLLCSQAHLPRVAERATEVGLAVADWHCAARLTVEEPDAGGSFDLPSLEQDLIGWVAEHAAASDVGTWSVARPDDSIVLVHTTRQSASADAQRAVRARMELVAAMLTDTHPGAWVRVGVATAHEGPAGLRVSAEEARTALAAAGLSGEPVSMSYFDALGGRRMLAEWLTTDAARDAVRRLLAPLDALGPAKAATAVATLHAYLDEQGSLVRAAERLHVHRNAVVYRLERITALGVDLSDADDRFALQMACRARLLTTGRPD